MATTTTLDQPRNVPRFTIKPRSGWQVINVSEIIAYRDLFYFLIWRDMKVRYAQSVLGIGWAIIQPVFQTVIFTFIFGKGAGIKAPHGWDYALFSFCATVPWSFFSTSLTEASGSLVSSAHMISKVYFPRLILPMTSVLGKLIDFAIAMSLLAATMGFYKHAPTMNAVFLPVLVIMMFMSAAGLGMWLTALAIQYRDVRYGMGFAVQILMYASPVIYSTETSIPEHLRYLYAANPMVGVIEGFRASLLGGVDMPWALIGISALSSFILFTTGALYFRRMERHFADVA
jgi:lipopolysaccharide transport system permease protein